MPTLPNDELLAELLERMLECTRAGDENGVEDVFQLHPELETELRELWATAGFADEFANVMTDSKNDDERTESITPSESIPASLADYEFLDEIGRGGMGVVYRARQKSLDRIVAIKMILLGELATETDQRRFISEAEAVARLQHPHIVPIHEVGEEAGRLFFSMQYIEGTTLAKHLAGRPISARDAAKLMIPICRAMGEAHRQGILHRDLKPSNILIDHEGRPYVTDFGLAKRFTPPDLSVKIAEDSSPENERTVTAAITHSNAIVGTPGYMSPEQASGSRMEVGESADVYGLGALLYAMLTGRAPFQAASPVDTIMMVLEQDPLPPRYLNRDLDPDLEMIVLKCLQKPSDLRYRTADKLADDLEAFLAGEQVSARSSRFSEILSRMFRETHHAGLLENWGLLWMWHSLVLIVLCVTTNVLQWQGVDSRLPFVALWGIGLGCWGVAFWNIRRRSGPTLFVERQIAHIWAGSIISSTLLFAIEAVLELPVLSLSPVIGVISGTVFLAKAGILSGRFYAEAMALFITAILMAVLQRPGFPNFGLTLFGFVSAACFFLPGWKYHRQQRRPR